MKTEKKGRFVYLKTLTSWSSVKDLLDILVPSEEVRVWDDRTGYHVDPHPIFTVYAKTLPQTEAYRKLNRSSNVTKIDRATFEVSIDLQFAKEVWTHFKCNGNEKKSTLLIMAGPSLPNKLKICNQIIAHSNEKTLLISIEEVRKYIYEKMDADEPSYSLEEDKLTEKISLELVRMALKNRCNVVFESRNMSETERMGAYAASSNGMTEVLVTYVSPVDNDRVYISGLKNSNLKTRLEKQVDVKFNRSKCSRPAIIMEPNAQFTELLLQISKNTALTFDL